ncbi:MAG TPA: protein kinase [Blastocatellia bacterium]|nr:protein kinase [Blastocatellia bacterium]
MRVEIVLGPHSRYKIIAKLGAGGMGDVYKAEDLTLLRTVAIKVMKRQRSHSASEEIRFLREARLASQINNPHIVTVHEIGETAEQSYIVMEYIPGRSLRELIDARALTPRMIVDISIQICDALSAAHAHGVIHRDIKPENIILNDRGLVKLLDFGLAKPIREMNLDLEHPSAPASLTEAGAVIGTVKYMSPEQLKDGPLDERTDIFSFGVVLYEMLTGRLPFSGSNSFDLAASILKDEPKYIASLPSGTPRGLADLAVKALEKDAKNRPSSVTDLMEQLEEIMHRLGRQLGDSDELTLKFPPLADDLSDRLTRTGESRPAYGGAPRSAHTILVLPLEAVGGQDESSFIGVGLAYAITTDLAKIPGLSVLSKSAGAGRVGDSGKGAHELARELGATIVLEGEVMRSGGMLGVMARLTDAESGRVIWGDQYRGDEEDLFSMQDAVCEGVAAALKVGISTEVRDILARSGTTNIEAFELYSKGRVHLERRDVRENIDAAIQMFDAALRLDNDFALAQAGLGEAYWLKYQDTREAEWVERAITASDRALVLDPLQAQVRISLGIVYNGTGRIDRAIEEFDRATELQPLNDDAHRWLGRCFMQKGDLAAATAYFEKAIEIRPGCWDNYNLLGICYYTFGRYQDAAEQFRRVVSIQPDNYRGYDTLGVMYLLLGRYEDAISMHERAIGIYENDRSYSNLGTCYFYLGRYEDAITAYRAGIDLNPRNDNLHRNLSDAYSRVGRHAEAEEQLKLAVDLLRENLSINATNAEMLGRLAVYQAKLQNSRDAHDAAERAIALEPHNTTIKYQRAVVNALSGRHAEAVAYLSDALSHGYSRADAQRDPDLEVLRELNEYKVLFAPPKCESGL